MTDRRLQGDLRRLVDDPLADGSRKPLGAAPNRPALPGGRGEATDEETASMSGGSANGGAIWDLDVLEAWGKSYIVRDGDPLVELDKFRVRDGNGNEGELRMNLTTRTNNVTPG